jgi:DNA polymerase-3 subunit alpha
MKNWTPLNCHSHYSILDALSKSTKIAERCSKLGYKSCAITDHGNIAGSIGFAKALKEVCVCGQQKIMHEDNGKGKCRLKNGCQEYRKNSIKPIIGCELNIPGNSSTSYLCVLAKNLQGWKDLIKIVSLSNTPESYKKFNSPTISLEDLSHIVKKGNIIGYGGALGSQIANSIFENPDLAYVAQSYDLAKGLVSKDWEKRLTSIIGQNIDIFGKDNFFLSVNMLDCKTTPASEIVGKAIRYVCKKNGWRKISVSDSHYSEREDAGDQRVQICSKLDSSLSELSDKIEKKNQPELKKFIRSNNYHIPTIEELGLVFEEDEIQNTILVDEMCELYDFTSAPILPEFKCPNNLTPDEYLRELCIRGWEKVWKNKVDKNRIAEYGNRIKMELQVFKDAGLASYFLIVQDYCSYAKNRGMLMSPGRGSGAGCMVSALIGITDKIVDPVKYGLYFERFYNAGRNAPGRISLPDIDSDFPIRYKEDIFNYVRHKYGENNVSQMITFSRMQGRGALKDVFRAHDVCSFEEINRITECIPKEEQISDELQIMREATGEASVIRWTLENMGEPLKNWCFINEEGKLEGQYSKLFEQAIRLEGTKRNPGKHPSGVIISAQPIAECCPMYYDHHSELSIAGLEMNDLEAIGLPKFDILAVAILDKIMAVQELVKTGKIDGE